MASASKSAALNAPQLPCFPSVRQNPHVALCYQTTQTPRLIAVTSAVSCLPVLAGRDAVMWNITTLETMI